MKNVVLDLSMNGGGAVISVAYTVGTIFGQSTVSVRNTLTDALLTENCRVDPNLDRVFDDADTLIRSFINSVSDWFTEKARNKKRRNYSTVIESLS